MSAPAIDPLTLQAYLAADYRVLDQPPFVIRPNQHRAALAACHARHQARCSALITACNPLGMQQDAPANATCQQALRAELDRRGLAHLPSIGLDPTGQWPAEPGHLIFNLSAEAASALGKTFGQNAILWAAADAIPRLVLLR